MQTPTRKKRLAAQERRSRILSAADEVFALRGFSGASMDEIAARAGITKPVLYDHFASKHDLFLAAAEAIRAALLEQAEAALAPGNVEGSLRTAFAAFFAFVEERPHAAQVLFVLPRGEPAIAAQAEAVQRGAREALAALMGRLLPDAEPWRVEAMTLFVQRGLHGLAEWWPAHKEVTRDQLIETVMRLVWTGIADRPERRP